MLDSQKHTTRMPIIRIDNNGIQEIEDIVVKEDRLSIYLNGQKIISTMCIIDSQDAYAVGFLMSEGVIEDIRDISDISISDDGLQVFIAAKINEDNIKNLFHEKTLTSGCCVGVSANFEGKIVEKFISQSNRFSLDRIRHALDEFNQQAELFEATGCVHKAMLFCNQNTFVSEDIGRHNAIDKVIGKARLNMVETKDSMIIVSGRLSMEMVIKCAMHDIPLVISRSAATFLGIKSAMNLGITLIGFARNGSMNIYTNKSRIVV